MAITLAGFSETDRQKIFRNALCQHNEGKDVFAGALFLTPYQRLKVDRTLRGQIRDKDVWAPLSRWQSDLPTELPKSNTEQIKSRSVNWENGAPRAESTNEIILARAEALRLEVWKQMLMKPPA